MQEPSDNWTKHMRTTLERVLRMTTEPMRPLIAIFLAMCAIYLLGFTRFSLFPVQSGAYSLFDAGQVLSTAISGVVVFFLVNAIVVLAFINKRIERMLYEFD